MSRQSNGISKKLSWEYITKTISQIIRSSLDDVEFALQKKFDVIKSITYESLTDENWDSQK